MRNLEGRLAEEPRSNIQEKKPQEFLEMAKAGEVHGLIEQIENYGYLLDSVNEFGQNCFHIAALHRHTKVLNLRLYEFVKTDDQFANSGYIRALMQAHDGYGNTVVHLAAKLAPLDHQCYTSVVAPAYQLQEDRVWFKEVENIVGATFKDIKNLSGQSPNDVFMAEHKEMMKEAEEFIRRTATSYKSLSTLIASFLLGMNLVLPLPNNNKLLTTFSSFDAAASVFSCVAMFMFVSLASSHYNDNDFFKSVLIRLEAAVTLQFLSIAGMMVAFGVSLYSYGHGNSTLVAFCFFVVGVPIAFLVFNFHFNSSLASRIGRGIKSYV